MDTTPLDQICLLPELKSLVYTREVLTEVLLLAQVQEHVTSAAVVLHQVIAHWLM